MQNFESKNFYERLLVPKNATREQITKAYRELAIVFHPDASVSAQGLYQISSEKHLDIFKGLSEAYSTLSDERRRAEYDKTLSPDDDNWEVVHTYSDGRAEPALKQNPEEQGGSGIRKGIMRGSTPLRASILMRAALEAKANDLGELHHSRVFQSALEGIEVEAIGKRILVLKGLIAVGAVLILLVLIALVKS